MTYIKWQDELEGYLGVLSREEKEKVFAYFAEMYADKRDAGLSEKEIIEEFGAPYDAAKRILEENGEAPPEQRAGSRARTAENGKKERSRVQKGDGEGNAAQGKRRADMTWLFVLLCILFAIPIFAVVVAMIVVTVSFCVVPISVIASGFAAIGCAIGGAVAGGGAAAGACMSGAGLIVIGIGFILLPIFFGLVKLMWKAFVKLFAALQRLFSGRSRV